MLIIITTIKINISDHDYNINNRNNKTMSYYNRNNRNNNWRPGPSCQVLLK